MNACFMSRFGYCPLVWINHSRTLNNCINGLNKKAFSIRLLFKFFRRDKSITIHNSNLKILAYGIFKIKNNMAPEIFPQRESNHSLGNSTALQDRSIKTPCMAQKLYLVWDQKCGTFY